MTNSEKYLKDEQDLQDFIKDLALLIAKGHHDATTKMRVNFAEMVCEWLDKETTPTLTEDERVILKNIPTKYWQKICRDNYGVLEIRGEYEKIDFHEDNISDFDEYNHLFQFIKNGEEYSIEELLNEDKS